MILYSAILCFDCYRRGVPRTGNLALFDAVSVSLTLPIFILNKFVKKPNIILKVLLHLAVVFQCFVFWNAFAVFIYTGSMEGTSIFLLFIAAPIGFYFYNLFYGLFFCILLFLGMVIYMWTPLHTAGYAFPDMYFTRLPLFFLAEVIICALAQFEIVKAQTKQEIARGEAEHANRAKSDFLSNMSHEIRTPINAILGMNEMIRRESAKGRKIASEKNTDLQEAFNVVSKYSYSIETAGGNLLSIINDILDFSKIEAGKVEIVNADYKLSSVINDVSNMIKVKAEQKELKYLVDVDKSIPDCLNGDEVRVRQVITNILNNAVKYTDEGSITLGVNAIDAKTDKGEKYIVLLITVTDTGMGIREEDKGKLFTKFQRINLQKTGTVEGTGLGLAITQSFLDLMGGRISVESEYGKGSTFMIELPQRVVSDEPIGNFSERFENSYKNQQVYKESFHAPGANILVVDDTSMNLMVFVGLLKDTEIKIDTALSGAEAINKSLNKRYDIIMMDQRMPEMDGTEAMKAIREDKSNPNAETPFICLTADAVSGARERYLSDGFKDYLTKPIDYKALEKMLITYLPKDKIQSGSTSQKTDKPGTDGTEYDEKKLLEEAGINVREGMMYCQNDPEFYRQVLTTYAESGSDKKIKLIGYYDRKDWKNYSILAHALKSTSKAIGADDFSEVAKMLEKAANDGEEDTIVREHENFLASYDRICNTIKLLYL